MTEVNQNPVQGDLLAGLAYVPFCFVITLFKKGSEEFYLMHSRRGALTSLIFFIPLIITAIIFYGFGSFIYGIYFTIITFLGLKAYKHEDIETPILDSIAKKIPLEKLLKKAAETVVGTGLEGKVPAPIAENSPSPNPTIINQSTTINLKQ